MARIFPALLSKGAASLAFVLACAAGDFAEAQTGSVARPPSPSLQGPRSSPVKPQVATPRPTASPRAQATRPSSSRPAAVRPAPVRPVNDAQVRPSSHTSAVVPPTSRSAQATRSTDDPATRAARVARARKDLARLDQFLATTMAPLQQKPQSPSGMPETDLGAPVPLTPNPSTTASRSTGAPTQPSRPGVLQDRSATPTSVSAPAISRPSPSAGAR